MACRDCSQKINETMSIQPMIRLLNGEDICDLQIVNCKVSNYTTTYPLSGQKIYFDEYEIEITNHKKVSKFKPNQIQFEEKVYDKFTFEHIKDKNYKLTLYK